MRTGYLYLEAHPDHPDRVRLRTNEIAPVPPEGEAGAQIIYIARFSDIDAALMHVHLLLQHKLVDVNAYLYSVSLAEAIAAVESVILSHQRVWISTETDWNLSTEIEKKAMSFHRKQQRTDMCWRITGIIGIIILFLSAIFIN